MYREIRKMKHFIADTHFNHKNIIKYCNRPFKSEEEMNETMIRNWNYKVTPQDTVYILGDFGFGDLEPILKRLNGKKILILGSHDKDTVKYAQYFSKITSLLEMREAGQKIVLCHYAMRVWSKSHYNSWHLYGHSHGKLKPYGKSWDVGVDKNNFTPLSFNEIKNIMKRRPDNFNLVKNKREK
jgi:calcineurin-like phosphoesterase family protein